MPEEEAGVKMIQVEEQGSQEEEQNVVNLRRQNSIRRSLRGVRAKSVVITEKERTLLLKQEEKMTGSPQPTKGFVKSMCRFYSDIIGDRKRTLLDRSVSFSAAKEKKTSLESITEGEKGDVASPLSSRSGSFRLLNRSRSWRESRSSELSDTPKRNSPTGQSVRSQDSGFSDSGENLPADLINASFDASPRETSPAEPYVTKIEIEGSSPVEATTGSYLRTIKSPVARERVAGSLGTIASLQEGLRTKLEIEPRSLHRSGLPQVPQVPPRTSVTLQRENPTLSPPLEASDHGPFSSSTPVRASFRRNRPQTMICLEENSHQQPTPVKRESRTRLKEIKSRRRWSSMEHAGPSSTSSPSPAPVVTGASPALRNRTPTNVNNTPVDISPVTAREVGSSVDRAESLCADGTETRLMLESFLEVSGQLERTCNNNSTLAASTIFPTNSLLLAGIANDTIIEHENKSNDGPEGPSSLNSSRTQADPVIKWWMELFMSTEPECMTYLQSKPILKSKEPVSPPSTPLAFYPYEMIKTTLVTKRAVLVTFSMLKR